METVSVDQFDHVPIKWSYNRGGVTRGERVF